MKSSRNWMFPKSTTKYWHGRFWCKNRFFIIYWPPIAIDLALAGLGFVLMYFLEWQWICDYKNVDSCELVSSLNVWKILGTLIFVGAIGGSIIYLIAYFLRPLLGLEYDKELQRKYQKPRYFFFPPKLVGYAESLLFPAAMLFHVPAFIPAWLTLSLLGGWDAWKDEKKRPNPTSVISISQCAVHYFCLHCICSRKG